MLEYWLLVFGFGETFGVAASCKEEIVVGIRRQIHNIASRLPSFLLLKLTKIKLKTVLSNLIIQLKQRLHFISLNNRIELLDCLVMVLQYLLPQVHVHLLVPHFSSVPRLTQLVKEAFHGQVGYVL